MPDQQLDEQRQPRPFIDAEQDRRLRRWGIRAWAWIGILLLAAMLYTGFSLVSGFVIPLIVAIVLWRRLRKKSMALA